MKKKLKDNEFGTDGGSDESFWRNTDIFIVFFDVDSLTFEEGKLLM